MTEREAKCESVAWTGRFPLPGSPPSPPAPQCTEAADHEGFHKGHSVVHGKTFWWDETDGRVWEPRAWNRDRTTVS